MQVTGINKFTFPLLIRKGIFSGFTTSTKLKTHATVLGRWSLKHEEKDLNRFYRYLPDPGYPNKYPESMNAGYEPRYNRSGKPQS